MFFTKNSVRVYVVLLALFFVSANVFAESTTDLKARMKARLPEINQLKAIGIIGEANDGLLGFISGASKKTTVVKAENTDRKKVYDAIAKQQGTTSEVVGNRRALQIYQKSKPGTWHQDKTGGWHKK